MLPSVACVQELPAPLALRVVTFNTGTTEGLPHDDPPDDGYGSEHAARSDQWYGDGLAWNPAVQAARSFFAETSADIVVFQEIFYSPDCADIPPEEQVDFVCESFEEGEPTVAQVILGDGWQVACNPGRNDKCAAVRLAVGSFRGCAEEFCLEGMDGFRVEGCGSGARIGRGVIDLVDGGALTLVNVHGSSGFGGEEQQCRVRQVEQVFVDLGDGAPGANGEGNLIMGDLNTDPGRLAEGDPSATRWNDFVGADKGFDFISDIGPEAPASYADLLNIDHVMSDFLVGTCWVSGLTAGHPPVIDAVYFDHKAVVCDVEPANR